MNIVEPFAIAMGYIIKVLYDITLNYGIAIILFTIVVKLLTLPLTIKQQKSLLETQKLQPIVEKLQNKMLKTIIPEYQVNPDIIGGLIIEIEDKTVDCSLKTKFENMQKQLTKGTRYGND